MGWDGWMGLYIPYCRKQGDEEREMRHQIGLWMDGWMDDLPLCWERDWPFTAAAAAAAAMMGWDGWMVLYRKKCLKQGYKVREMRNQMGLWMDEWMGVLPGWWEW
jgi:hypothetical protein